MSLATSEMTAAPVRRRSQAEVFWIYVDALLLSIVLFAASDGLVQLGPVQSAVWLLCYAVTLLRIWMNWPSYLRVLYDNRVLFAFPVICIFTVIWSHARGETLVNGTQLLMTFLIATYLGWRYTLNIVFKAIAVVISVAVILSLVHWLTGIFPWPVYTRAGGLAGFYSHKNMLGQKAMMSTIVLISIFLMPRNEASGGTKAIFAVIFALTILAIFLSQSMTSVLLFPVTSIGVLLLARRRVPRGLFLTVILALVLGLALGPLAFALLGQNPVDVVLDAVGKSSDLTGRTDLWATGLGVWSENPVFGVGYSAFRAAPEFYNLRMSMVDTGALKVVAFHNFIIENGVAGGIAGILGIVAVLYVFSVRVLWLRRATGSVAASGAIIMGIFIMIAASVGAFLYRQHEMMLVLIVLFAVSAGEDIKRVKKSRSGQQTVS